MATANQADVFCPVWTAHADARQSFHNVPRDAVKVAVDWGRIYYQHNGRTAYFIGYNEVAAAARCGADIARYVNIAVVLGIDGAVVTVVRTADTGRIRRERRADDCARSFARRYRAA